MGYARIITGGEDGRYTIEVDYGAATKTALLDALSTLLASLDTKLGLLLGKLAQAEAREAEELAQLEAAQLAYIIASQNLIPGAPQPDSAAITFYMKRLAEEKVRNAPLRLQIDAVRFDRGVALKRIAYWNNFSPLETRDVWCTDFTEDGAADSLVATAEIPGEPGLIVLAPGCRAPINGAGVITAGDGALQGREIMSPAQAFFNAAILPGWQKFKPTYRWGTCTAIDTDADTMSVSLADASSSAQGLDVNQASSLTGVPVTYMTCNASAFEVGDRVVVQFVGQDWGNPRVVGFLDNPRPCSGWQARFFTLVTTGIAGPARYFVAIFKSISPNDVILEKMAAATLVEVDFRVDRGAWIVPDGLTTGPLTTGRTWQNPDGVYGGIVAGLQITFVPPGSLPNGDGSFSASPGEPAHFRVMHYIDSGWAPTANNAPFYPINSIIEARMRINGVVFANVAVKSNFPPFQVDSRASIPASVTNATQLPYVLFEEDGT
jgi:hypothetical protein